MTTRMMDILYPSSPISLCAALSCHSLRAIPLDISTLIRPAPLVPSATWVDPTVIRYTESELREEPQVRFHFHPCHHRDSLSRLYDSIKTRDHPLGWPASSFSSAIIYEIDRVAPLATSIKALSLAYASLMDW